VAAEIGEFTREQLTLHLDSAVHHVHLGEHTSPADVSTIP
jgi:hypothetical protein